MGKQFENSNTSTSSHRRRKTKKQAANTRNLVNQLKPIFKFGIEELLNDYTLFDEEKCKLQNLFSRLHKEVNIHVLGSCLKNKNFNSKMTQWMESGQLVKMITSSRKEYRSYANILIYLNKIMNAIKKSQLMTDGFWTRPFEIDKDKNDVDNNQLYFGQEMDNNQQLVVEANCGNDFQKNTNDTAEELKQSGVYN